MKLKQTECYKQAAEARWLTFSNILTLSRIFLAPVIFVGIAQGWWQFSFIVFLVAAATDLLDGHLARALNDKTSLGTLLDPIADKIFLLTAFCALSFYGTPLFKIPWWFFLFVVIREIVLVVGGIFLICRFDSMAIKPSLWGKMTTFLQLLFIAWVIIGGQFCYFLLVILTIFSCVSLGYYIYYGLQLPKENRKND